MESPREELEKRWSQLGLNDEDLRPREDGTLLERSAREVTTGLMPGPAPSSSPIVATTLQAPGAALPPLDARPAAPLASPALVTPLAMLEAPADHIVLGPVLGGGGMGVVHLAEQPALRREIAVKVLRPERKTGSAVNALLREAWVMGTLEHPNIVPVHLLVREDDGTPRVVMKRIEGVAWDAIIEAPALAAQLGGGEAAAKDPLEFHLRVLIAVCHAVHFAHSRGILHLDLKPDNVMVGRFGEVLVVDWGIAASFGDDAPAWLPPARAIRGVRGTPAWIAPELAAADGPRVGPHTDVYLLGGMLHAVLTGTVRHEGEEVRDILAAAFESAPIRYPDGVPAELAALANRATAREPEARPPSAEAFRRALEDFLGHRASNLLTDEAQRALGPLLVRLAERGDKGAGRGADSIRRDFLECQFAFRQALQIWHDNPVAKSGLQTLLRAMAMHALDHRQLERAAECLHAMNPGDPELSRRLTELARDAVLDHERLKALERDADPNINYRKRGYMALATGLLFLSWNLACGWLHRSGTLTFGLTELIAIAVITCGVFGTAAMVIRRSMLDTAANRRLVVLFGSGFASILVFWLAALQLAHLRPELNLDALDILSVSNWVYTYFVLAVTFTMDPRVAWLAAPSAAIALLAPLYRTYAFELLGLGGFVVGVGLYFIWRTPWKGRPSGSRAA